MNETPAQIAVLKAVAMFPRKDAAHRIATGLAKEQIDPLQQYVTMEDCSVYADRIRAASEAEIVRLTIEAASWKHAASHLEGERDALRDVVTDLRDIIDRNMVDSGKEEHRLFLDGEVYTGPAVDFLHRLMTAVRGLCDKALTPRN